MLRDRVLIRFDGSQDKAAYDRELAARPDLMRWLLAGAQSADQIVAPRLRRGVFGCTVAQIDAAVVVLCRDALGALRRGVLELQPDESEVHFWRLGFMGAVAEARDTAFGHKMPAPN